jgi:uncharacterized repeat protein (TIGR01451 family)
MPQQRENFVPVRVSPRKSGQENRSHSVLLATALMLLVTVLLPLASQAQNNYVYANNQDVVNTVAAYSVSASGTLTPVPGSLFLTGGAGSVFSCYGLDRIVVSPTGNFLYVSNFGDQSISVLQINPANGSLISAPGSPFPSGLTLDTCGGMSLAATPDGKFLMASSNGQIRTFNVALNGALTLAQTTANCCSSNNGMKISPNGRFLATANGTSASVFTIDALGSLTPVLGSPFPIAGAGSLAGLEFSCGNDRLFGGEATGSPAIADAWSIDATGALAPVAGSPFTASGANSNVVLLSPNNAFLLQSNQFSNSINTFTVAADGSLTPSGSYGGVGFLHLPAGMAVDHSGTFLYVADETFGLAVLRITGNGTLSNVVDVSVPGVPEVQGLAAYPPKGCSQSDLALSIVADSPTVNAGANVTYTISVTNNGPDAASAGISDNLPAGLTFISCAATAGGVCGGSLPPNKRTVSFPSLASGETQTATIVAQLSGTFLNGDTINNTAAITNNSGVDSNPANDSASALITVHAPLVATSLFVRAQPFAFYGGNAVLSVVLSRTSNNSAVAGKSINFTVSGKSVGSALSDANGIATLVTSEAGLAPGTYPGAVNFSFPGDIAFATSSATADLQVGQAILTVIPDASSRVYGDPNPPFTYTIAGLAPGDPLASVISGTAICGSAATSASDVGAYHITCSPGTLTVNNPNYVLAGPGPFSAIFSILSVTQAPLTLQIDNLSRLYGDPNPPVSGTITGLKNGDNITASYTTAATVFSPVGTYPITPAFVDPNNRLFNYQVVLVGASLTILPAPLTVTVNSASRLYGDPNPPFTGSIIGIKNNDNITVTYSSAATPASPVGAYPITANLIDPAGKLGNYALTINNGSLTIAPAPLTVTINNATRLYGNANPAFSGTISGLKNADLITATFSTTATAASPVGNYAITALLVDPGGKLGNYSVTVNNGTLTITPAPLTFTVNNASRIYGNANPTFSGTFTGLKNADPITAAFSSVDQTASVGTYPITATLVDPAGRLPNYTVTVKNGTLTITRAPLTVTGFNGSRLYGDPNPAPTISGLKNNDPITGAYNAASPTAASPIGTYTMVPVLNDPANKLANYTVTLVNGRMTINRAPLSVTVNSFTRNYGASNPAFTGVISGIKNSDNITATYNTIVATSASTSPGSFTIAATLSDPTGKLGNYTVANNSGTLTINRAPLTITANSQTIILNGTALASAAYSGFVLGQGPANLTGALSCTAPAGSVGTSTITCSGQTSTNYAITFVPGAATVIYQIAGVNCTNGPGHVILAPINAGGSSTFTKATTPSIPVQFRVCNAQGTSISATVISSFALTAVNGAPSSTPAPLASDNQPFHFVGGTLAGGAGSQGWQFNLSTANLSKGVTYAYRINLNDGTSINFQFAVQ